MDGGVSGLGRGEVPVGMGAISVVRLNPMNIRVERIVLKAT
jgi:hypothetical protein